MLPPQVVALAWLQIWTPLRDLLQAWGWENAMAFGNPLQEEWIDTNLDQLGGAVAMGVGGLVDHLAGDLVRAPKIVRRAKRPEPSLVKSTISSYCCETRAAKSGWPSPS